MIDKFVSDADLQYVKAFEQVVIDGNTLLNAGINLLLNLGAEAVGTAFNNANARIGVGNSTAAEAATQTVLQAATNKTHKAMNATYPTSGTSQQIVFRSIFGGTEAGLRNGSLAYSGSRFTEVSIPRGTAGNSATLAWTALFSRTIGTPEWLVSGFDPDDTATFTTESNLEARALTSASSAWSSTMENETIKPSRKRYRATRIIRAAPRAYRWTRETSCGSRRC